MIKITINEKDEGDLVYDMAKAYLEAERKLADIRDALELCEEWELPDAIRNILYWRKGSNENPHIRTC